MDDDQLQAVNHRGSNLLIITGAGSSKTRTLKFRAISLLDKFLPENLTIVTFTNKAALEISDRITSNVSEKQRKALQSALKRRMQIGWMLAITTNLMQLRARTFVFQMALVFDG